MAYICETLTAPNLITGNQTCTKWILEQPSSSILPTLSTADKDAMLLWFVSIFAVVFVVRSIIRLF